MVELFEASCAADEVIVMTYARFGQMRVGRCIATDLGYIGCGADVMYIFDDKCSGKQSCSVQVGDENMDERSTCISGLKEYLQADYICKKTYKPDTSVCSNTHDVLMSTSALVTSDGLYESNCVRLNERWTLSTTSGQRLNISLIDFSHEESPSNDEVFGHVTDESSGLEMSLRAQSRHQHVMTSTQNKVTVRLSNDRRFAFDVTGGWQYIIERCNVLVRRCHENNKFLLL